jgi:hypothetical protein
MCAMKTVILTRVTASSIACPALMMPILIIALATVAHHRVSFAAVESDMSMLLLMASAAAAFRTGDVH